MTIISRSLLWAVPCVEELADTYVMNENVPLTADQVSSVSAGGVLVLVYLLYDPVGNDNRPKPAASFTEVSFTQNLSDPAWSVGIATRPLDTDCVSEIKASNRVTAMTWNPRLAPRALVKNAYCFAIDGDISEAATDIFVKSIVNNIQNDDTEIPQTQVIDGIPTSNDIPAATQAINIFDLAVAFGLTRDVTLSRKSDGAVVKKETEGLLYYQVSQAYDVTLRPNLLREYTFDGQDIGFGVTLLFTGISDGLISNELDIDRSDCNISVFDILASLYVSTLRYTYEQCFNGNEDGSGVISDIVIGASFTGGYDLEQIVADICYAYNIERKFTANGIRFYKNKIGLDVTNIVAVIDASELAVTDTSDDGIRYVISTDYADDSNIVTQLALNFIDADNQYATNQVAAKRPDALQTDPVKSISLPFVMHVNTAEKLVNQLLTVGRLSLITHTLRLPPKYAWIGKGDVITINHDEFNDTMRITNTDFNADKSQTITTVTVATATNTVPNSNYVAPPAPDSSLVASYPIALDIPALIPADTQGDDAAGMFEVYYGATPTAKGYWLGAYVTRKLDGAAWETLFHTYGQASKAGSVIVRYTAKDALTNKRWLTDSDTLTLINPSASWDEGQNTDKAGLLQYPLRNLAAYGMPGRWELIQFEAIKAGVMSGIRRGLRGTEGNCGLHQPGDRVIPLVPGLSMSRLPRAQLGKIAINRAVTEGTPFTSAEQVPGLAFQGNSRRPFAPYHFRGSRGSNGDVTFAWNRRDRNGSGWGKAAPPQSEAALAFKVDVCDTDGVLLRSLAASDTTVIYTAANQQADNAANNAEFVLQITQIGDIGPGFVGSEQVSV